MHNELFKYFCQHCWFSVGVGTWHYLLLLLLRIDFAVVASCSPLVPGVSFDHHCTFCFLRRIQVKQVSAAPGTIFEVAEQSGDWLRVLMGEAASAWMSSSAQGTPLLKPARKDVFIMDPAVRTKYFVCVCCLDV